MSDSSDFSETIREIEHTPLYGHYHTTVYVPPTESPARIIAKLSDEMKIASERRYSHKSAKLLLLTEISAIIFRFAFKMDMPENGLIVFCGVEKTTDYGLTRPINRTVEPPTPIKEFKIVIGRQFETGIAKTLV